MKLSKISKHNHQKTWWKNKTLFVLVGLVFFTAFTCLIFLAGLYSHKLKLDQTGIIRNTTTIAKASMHPMQLLLAKLKAKPEKIYIDIKHKHFQRIAYKREVALSQGILFSSGEDYVPATIRHAEKEFSAKLRLKGDLPDHWETDKWSLRIKIKKDNTLFGMKNFSLQHPLTRVYVGEWLAQEALRKEGIISLRYKFVDVTINGKHKGIYALEEHFEKRLIEHNEYREGPIVKFNEDLRWLEYANHKTHETDYGAWSSSIIDGYGKDISENSLFVKASSLLEGFRNGTYKTTEIFDGKKLAFYIALKDLFGSSELDWNDFRFYYNPVTSKLEPIGFDFHFDGNTIDRLFSHGGGVKYKNKRWEQNPYSLAQLLFRDHAFTSFYNQALTKISQPQYFQNLMKEVEEELDSHLNIIHSEYPSYKLPLRSVSKNAEFIRKKLEPAQGIHAYLQESKEDHISLEIGNIQSMPVQIFGVTYNNKSIPFSQEIILSPKQATKSIDYQLYNFHLQKTFQSQKSIPSENTIQVNYKIIGTANIRTIDVLPWPRVNPMFLRNDFIRQKANYEAFSFFKLDKQTKKIFIMPGIWPITTPLIIPKGYSVWCGPGTILELSNAATILSYSPLEFHGTPEAPIIIKNASDFKGQGLTVIEAFEKSILEHVIFQNLTNPSKSGWEIPGAVTFYKSPVEISNCQFLQNKSEDGLNLIKSQFTIQNSLFEDTLSDALDSDFSDGTITNSSFVNCGNDGIDISGSVVKITNVTMNKIGDKGLSAGENSTMSVQDFSVTDSEIAVASKDLSEIKISGIKAINSKIGFTVYQKKPEFGPGNITATNLLISGSDIPYMVEEKSKLTIDGKSIVATHKNVEKILYGAEYGKSSK